jgi:rhodanese-related sulfurtransferase
MSFLFNRFNTPDYGELDTAAYHDNFYRKHIDHALIDVRTPAEFQGGHLPGATSIPLHELAARIGEIPQDKPVVIVCATGNRSGAAAGALLRAGYDAERVFNLRGGTMMWMMNGLPLE